MISAARAREPARSPLRPRRLVPAAGARRPGVVRHLARPDELPERRQRSFRVETGLVEEIRGTWRRGRAPRGSRPPPRSRARRAGGLAEDRRVLSEVDGDAVETRTGPDELAGGAGRPARQAGAGTRRAAHLALPEGDRKRQPLQRNERLAQGRTPADPRARRVGSGRARPARPARPRAAAPRARRGGAGAERRDRTTRAPSRPGAARRGRAGRRGRARAAAPRARGRTAPPLRRW